MDPQSFLARFQVVANATGGVRLLREMILDLALQGRLVDQDPSDEPAERLLDRISESRHSMIESMGIRQRAIPELQIPPAPLPEGWCWTQLDSLGVVAPRNIADDDASAGFIPMELIQERYGQPALFEIRPWGEIRKGYTHVADGDVAVAKITPCFQNGKSAVFSGLPGGLGAATTELHVLRPAPDGVLPEYLLIYLRSPGFVKAGVGSMTGTAGQQRVPRDYFSASPFPLPPRAEQCRIVARVDELMQLCDDLVCHQQSRGTSAIRFRASALDALVNAESDAEVATAWTRVHDNWETMAGNTHSVGDIRRAILELAVHGKLVAQDDDDEPAEDLLRNLRESRNEWLRANQSADPECATMLRKLAKLPQVQSPYTLPPGWASASLIDLCRFLVDCHNKTAPYSKTGIPIVRTTNIRHGQLRWNDMKYVTDETYEFWSRRCPPVPGDIMFTREAPMGEAAIIPPDTKVCLGQRTMLIRPEPGHMNVHYLLLALREPGLLSRSTSSAVGATVKHFRVGDVERFAVAVPPIDEQHRIVARVRELMTMCDELEGSLASREMAGGHLARSAVHHIVR
jgi:type I restriction enzyme S subunit